MNFSEIIGQKEVIASLTGAVKSDRVGHAYVFNGPRGIGKRTVAKIYAQMLLCLKNEGETPCKCSACNMFELGSNPDFIVIGDNDDTNISIDEIRNLQSDIIIRPLYSKRKVYLIIEADRMTTQAQNCLLKILEEPPAYAALIMTTCNSNALLETIRSRTLKYNFKKNTYDEVRDFLKARSEKDIKGIEFITSFSDGIIGNALELTCSEDFVNLREAVTRIVFKLAGSALEDVFDIYDFFEANKASIDRILDIMLLLYRDIMVSKLAENEILLINSDKKDIILSNAQVLSISQLTKAMDIIEQARRNIKQNANYQLSIEVMLMKLQEECA